MATPESKVKKSVYATLEKYPNVYRITPTTGGYGSSGAPDIVVCMRGRFIGIECKAKGNKPTALQLKNLNAIVEAGGYAFVIDEGAIGVFRMVLDLIVWNKEPPKLYDFTRELSDKDTTENK
jgi:hypothetical protein